MMAYNRAQTAKYYQIMASMSEKPPPSLKEAIQRAVIPWQAPPLTPDERGAAFLGSSIMGKHVVLEEEFMKKLRHEHDREQRRRVLGERERRL